jgi:hypothetical protein
MASVNRHLAARYLSRDPSIHWTCESSLIRALFLACMELEKENLSHPLATEQLISTSCKCLAATAKKSDGVLELFNQGDDCPVVTELRHFNPPPRAEIVVSNVTHVKLNEVNMSTWVPGNRLVIFGSGNTVSRERE